MTVLEWTQFGHSGKGLSLALPRAKIILTISVRYDTARKIKKSQDEYCAKALREEWNDLGLFPEDLQWEALVDVLRGRVKAGFESYCN